MHWDDLLGHRDQIDMLRRSIGRGRLAHAYLFAGPPGVGKARFARIFAQCLLCERHDDQDLLACNECSSCKQANAGTHPDFFTVGLPEGKNEIPVDVFKGAKDKRNEGLIHDLSLRPMAGTRRVAILDDANRMNEEGANAMLKTIEEPPENSLLILIAENLDAILPTIRSRCQLLRFGSLSSDHVAQLLMANEVASTDDEAQAAAAMSDGSLRTASQLLNPELRRLRGTLYQALGNQNMKPLEVAKTITSTIEEISSDTPEQRVNVGWLIRFAQEFYRQATMQLSTDQFSEQVAPEIATYCQLRQPNGFGGVELAMEQFDRTVLAESHIDWNINPARAIESMLEDLAKLGRNK